MFRIAKETKRFPCRPAPGDGTGARSARAPARRRPRPGARAALLALATAAALLAPAPAAARYTVELIVFEHLGAARLHDELWAEDPGLPPFGEAVEPEAGASRAFRLLGPGSHGLNGVWSRLARSEGYRPLLHLAWRQPSLAKRRARPVRVRGAGAPEPASGGGQRPLPQPAVDGTVLLYASRFLHLEADLLYYRGRSEGASPGAAPAPGEDGAGDGFPAVFRLTQKRRMRLDELHYLDHPLIGVLVRVTR